MEESELLGLFDGIISIRVIPILSTKLGLWETTIRVPGKSRKFSPMIFWVSGSRWLVGSSRMMKFGLPLRIFAMATRAFSPGERTETFLKTSSPVKRKLERRERSSVSV